MRKVVLSAVALISVWACNCFGQILIQSVVNDTESQKPDSFVIIGVVNGFSGTKSSNSGRFELLIRKDFNSGDSVRLGAEHYNRRNVNKLCVLDDNE